MADQPEARQHEDVAALLAEQRAYYRARAAEYDEWWLRRGRYDRGPIANVQWFAETARVERALADVGPVDDAIELACGTGLWTERLAASCKRLTAIDASTEMLAVAEARVPDSHVTFQQADLFSWQPERQVDLVVFTFWLSHVPLERFDAFWATVASALKPGGRVFFVDSRYTPDSTAVDHWLPDRGDGVVERKLNDGQRFRIVKIFHEPTELSARLSALGWDIGVRASGEHFYWGLGGRLGDAR